MRSFLPLVALILFVVCSSAFCTYFTFGLSGAQALPPTDAPGFAGVGGFLCEDHRFVGSAAIITTETVTAVEIHGPATQGSPGPVLFVLPLPVGNTVAIDLGPLNSEQIGAFTSQQLYMDVHTTAHPGGALGGLVRIEVSVQPHGWGAVKALYK